MIKPKIVLSKLVLVPTSHCYMKFLVTAEIAGALVDFNVESTSSVQRVS